MSGPLLQIENLAKRFGGIVATDDLALNVGTGELHAVIGPNGAGKTTLIAQLSGQLAPDAGRIRFEGHDITALPMHRPQRARLGALVPDHVAVSRSQRARQCGAGSAGACRTLVSVLARGAPGSRLAPAGARGARTRRPVRTGRAARRRT